MKMLKFVYTIFLLSILSKVAFGQVDSLHYEDVIKLNNGFVTKCKIIGITETGINVIYKNGVPMTFSHSGVKVVKQCKDLDPILKISTNFDEYRNILWQLSIGGSFGVRDQIYSNKVLFDSQTTEGILKMRISQLNGGHFIRTNIAKIKMETVFPLSMWHIGGGYEFVLSRKKVSPFIFGNVGYSFGLKVVQDQENNSNIEYTNKGGINYEPGVGLLLRSSHGYAFTLSSSFFYQPATINILSNNQPGNSFKYDLKLQRSFLKLGFVF